MLYLFFELSFQIFNQHAVSMDISTVHDHGHSQVNITPNNIFRVILRDWLSVNDHKGALNYDFLTSGGHKTWALLSEETEKLGVIPKKRRENMKEQCQQTSWFLFLSYNLDR